MSDNNELDRIKENTINLDNLPSIDNDVSNVPAKLLTGFNNVEDLLKGFYSYMAISKRITSENTKRTYLSNVKQFLIWCNKLQFAVKRVDKTLVLRNLIITYEKALSSTDLAQNSKAIKQASVRKFFEYYEFLHPEYNIDLRKCFSSDFITTGDPNAYKRVTRINAEVFNALMEAAYSEDINSKWIFYFFCWGLRRSEISTVKVSDLDFLNKEINIFQHKQGTNKRIPMPDWCNESIINRADVYIIHNNSKRSNKTKGKVPVTDQFIYTKLLSWRAKTDFKTVPITPHSMRRYFVSALLKQGASDSNIARLGGWASPMMVSRYGYDINLQNNPIILNNQVKY